MNILFYRPHSFKLANLSICYELFPVFHKWNAKVINNVVIRSCSSTFKHRLALKKNNHSRSILRSKEIYHFALFDLQLEQHPNKFKITDSELLSELKDWVFAARAEGREESAHFNFVSSRRSPFVVKLERCDISDCLKVLAFCVNLSEELNLHKENKTILCSYIYKCMLKEIDEVFEKKLGTLNINVAMLMVDAWILISNPDCQKSIIRVLKALSLNLDKIKDYQVVYTFYILGAMKVGNRFIGCAKIQEGIRPVLERLSLDEMAVISHGLHKNRIKIPNEGIQNIFLDKFLSECVTTNSDTLRSIIKLIKTFEGKYDALNFQEKIIPQVHKLSPAAVPHVIGLALLSKCFNEKLVSECVKHVKPILKKCSLNEFDSILQAVSTYEYEDDDLFKTIIEELAMRRFERNEFPHVFISCTYWLVLRGIAPANFIKYSLTPRRVKFCLRLQPTLKSEYAYIDAAAELEIPDYDGPRLSAKTRKDILWAERQQTKKIYGDISRRKVFCEVKKTLVQLYGESIISEKFILPHYSHKFDIVGFDRDLNPILPPKKWIKKRIKKNDVFDFIYPPDDKNIWVIPKVIFNRNWSPDPRRITSHTSVNERLITKLGYHFAQVCESIWLTMFEDREKEIYLRTCLTDKVTKYIQGTIEENYRKRNKQS